MYKTAATKIRTVVAFVSTSIITFTVRRITTPKSVFPIVLLNTLTLTIYTTTRIIRIIKLRIESVLQKASNSSWALERLM